MFESILTDDFFIDLSEKDNEEIICSGRGRFQGRGQRTVPRLPHAAFIIKRQIEDEEASQGRRKRGRGRASLIRQAIQNSDSNLFKPRLPHADTFQKVDEGTEKLISADTNKPTNNHLDFHNQEEYPSLMKDNHVLQKEENFPLLSQKNDIYGGSSDNNSERSVSRELARARREKEKQSQKESFAEINRQMFSELAITFQDEASYKPVKVMRLTKANLEQHVRETEDVLKVASFINTSQKPKTNASSDTSELYDQFGVTLDDIWLFKQNKFKMPQEVKNKVNEINKLSELYYEGCENDEHYQMESNTGDQKEENVAADKNDQVDNIEHEKQVSFLNMLYDEDSWSNQKELSENLSEDNNDCISDSIKSNQQKIEKINDQIESNSSIDAISSDKVDNSNDMLHEKEVVNGDTEHNSTSDQTDNLVSNISTDETDEDVFNEKAAVSENASFFSITSDLNMTVKFKGNGAGTELKTSDHQVIRKVISPALPDITTDQEAEDRDNEPAEIVLVDTDTSTSKPTSYSDVNESSLEIIDSDLSVSKTLDLDNKNIVLYSESSDVTSEGVVVVNDAKCEVERVNERDKKDKRSSVALLDEFDIPEPLKDSSNNAFEFRDSECEAEDDDFIVIQSKGKKQKNKQSAITNGNHGDFSEKVFTKTSSKSKKHKNQGNHKCSEGASQSTDKIDKHEISVEKGNSVCKKEVIENAKSQGNLVKFSDSNKELDIETELAYKYKLGKVSDTPYNKCEKSNAGDMTIKQTDHSDDMGGFQVVKKKQRKKRSISPKGKQRKHAGKQENTLWKLYGKTVLQVESLPLDFDVDTLNNIVGSFGTVMDFQVREMGDSISVRYRGIKKQDCVRKGETISRLSDEDSCDYAVQCIDQTNIGTLDENCVLSCTKLTN